MQAIPALVGRYDGELRAYAPVDHPGAVVLDLTGGPGGVEIALSAADARRLMYQVSCAALRATALEREALAAAAPYAHA